MQFMRSVDVDRLNKNAHTEMRKKIVCFLVHVINSLMLIQAVNRTIIQSREEKKPAYTQRPLFSFVYIGLSESGFQDDASE